MVGDFLVFVNETVGSLAVLVVYGRVNEYVQTHALARGYGYYGHAQHFGQTVQVYFHAALHHYVHHVERYDDGFAQL